jgi:protein-export membrane protein SecD
MYVAIMLALFKLIPVTLTAAGIAGFIISIGIAVDANVLIFERIKEELKGGRAIIESTKNGFARAWLSIRDSNVSSMITAIILFWFGTPLIKGFALTFLIGVLVSMISAISITRLFLSTLNINKTNKITGFLFGSGFTNAKTQK